MRTKQLISSLLTFIVVAVVSFMSAPTASAKVTKAINGWYGGHYNEELTINYNPKTGRATVVYSEKDDNGKSLKCFKLNGKVQKGYLVVSGKGVSNGKNTTMTLKISEGECSGVDVNVVFDDGRTALFSNDNIW